jgi:hypothetical protein
MDSERIPRSLLRGLAIELQQSRPGPDWEASFNPFFLIKFFIRLHLIDFLTLLFGRRRHEKMAVFYLDDGLFSV